MCENTLNSETKLFSFFFLCSKATESYLDNHLVRFINKWTNIMIE